MESADHQGRVHQGRNIKRFREIFGIKQEALALELGDDWSQKKVSRLEENERVEEDVLEQVAKILKVPVEAIKNFDEQAAIVYFNTFADHSFSNSNGAFSASNCTFNPVDKIVELYEALLKSEREKLEILKSSK
jgi:transcriptional regulator with XRE-family HTH domain